jgi:hypothetical protein
MKDREFWGVDSAFRGVAYLRDEVTFEDVLRIFGE